MDVKLPLFLFEGSLQLLCESLDELLESVEAVDVEAEIYQVFDAAGRRLTLSLELGYTDLALARVRAEESGSCQPEELRRRLLEVLERLNIELEDLEDLAELVSFFRGRHFQSQRKQRWSPFRRKK